MEFGTPFVVSDEKHVYMTNFSVNSSYPSQLMASIEKLYKSHESQENIDFRELENLILRQKILTEYKDNTSFSQKRVDQQSDYAEFPDY